MKAYVYELQNRPDGITNVIAPEMRTEEHLALSYYYERVSKMTANTQFKSVVLTCIREDGKILQHKVVETAYTA